MKRGEIDALICWHTDRLYRCMKDLERLIEIADADRVQIRTVNGGDLDLSTSRAGWWRASSAPWPRQESEHKGERQRRANVQKAAAGKWQTANRAFGYTMTGEPLEPEATAFRTAVADVLAGKSIRGVAAEWNAAGSARPRWRAPPRSATARSTSSPETWNSPRVRRLLVNPRYAGLKVHRGKVIGKGDWTPLIDEDTHRGLVAYLTRPVADHLHIVRAQVHRLRRLRVRPLRRPDARRVPRRQGRRPHLRVQNTSACGAARRTARRIRANTLCWATCRNRRPGIGWRRCCTAASAST